MSTICKRLPFELEGRNPITPSSARDAVKNLLDELYQPVGPGHYASCEDNVLLLGPRCEAFQQPACLVSTKKYADNPGVLKLTQQQKVLPPIAVRPILPVGVGVQPVERDISGGHSKLRHHKPGGR